MQSDFHYNTIKALASSAGFPEPDAQTIAYASQYVDDATEHEAFRVDGIPKDVVDLLAVAKTDPTGCKQGNPLLFNPVCTAHTTIQMIGLATKKEVQRKTYIPFHFVPGKPYTLGNGAFDYRVQPDGDIARAAVKTAAGLLKDAKPDDRELALVRLGVTLHPYADQWAHQLFSGRWNNENDVEDICTVTSSGAWENIGWIEQLKRNILPDIGHAELINFPDQAGLSFSYEHRSSKVTRHNSNIFLDAAAKIYEYLCFASAGTIRPWFDISSKFHGCFTLDPWPVRLTLWKRAFPGVDFRYDKTEWRRLALGGMHVEWDRFEKADFHALSYKALGDLKFFLFHVAARDHRMAVISQIRQDLV